MQRRERSTGLQLYHLPLENRAHCRMCGKAFVKDRTRTQITCSEECARERHNLQARRRRSRLRIKVA